MPLCWGIKSSFHSNTPIDPFNFDVDPVYEFVGLENYKYVLSDLNYRKSLNNTIKFTIASVSIIIPFGFILAHLIRCTNVRLRPVFTFCLLLPGLTPPAVLAVLFLLFFHGDQGMLNNLIVKPFGFEPINWTKDPQFILFALVLQSVWRWTGFIAFFVLCGMDALPKGYSEAARVEGVGQWRFLFFVTLPLVRHILIFACIFLLVDAFSMFSGAYSLLGGSGGTDNAGLLLVTHVYHTAFGKGNFADAAAISLSVAPVLMLLIFVAVFRPGKRDLTI